MLLLFLFLVIVLAIIWYVWTKYHPRKLAGKASVVLPKDYFIGLQYLIDEQPDKAVDVFVKLLEVNSETVETHLALGGLFRRKGEVNRAIRIHQNLIARPQLGKKQRIRALFELAQDYLNAGVLDRAEDLFLELVKSSKDNLTSLQNLLSIYEQQKEWRRAISIARKLEDEHKMAMSQVIAHYYCELGQPKKALFVDKDCVRASLMLGDDLFNSGNFKQAISLYNQVKMQDPTYLSEIITPLAKCYEYLQDESAFMQYLQEILAAQSHPDTVGAYVRLLRKQQDDSLAIEFMIKRLHQYPSLQGLSSLLRLYIDNSAAQGRRKLTLLQTAVDKLLHDAPHYSCVQCGFSSKSLYWQCPACRRWGSVKPR